MNTIGSVSWHSAIHPSIPQGERLNARQHPTNTILPQHDWLKTKQRPQNIIWPRYDWLQSRSAYQNKAVRPDSSTGSGQGTLRVLKKHKQNAGVTVHATSIRSGQASIPQHERLKNGRCFQNKAVRPEVSKGEHLIFVGMEIVEEVEALRLALGETT